MNVWKNDKSSSPYIRIIVNKIDIKHALDISTGTIENVPIKLNNTVAFTNVSILLPKIPDLLFLRKNNDIGKTDAKYPA